MISIKMIPAEYGDCFLISVNKKFNILVGGGLKVTYAKWIKPLVFSESNTNTFLDLVVVSHIDCDHISGIIALLQEGNNKQGIKVKEIWHNGLFQIIAENFSENEKTNEDEAILDHIIQKGHLTKEPKAIGISESFSLDVLIQENNIVRNGGKEGIAISDTTEDYILGKLSKIVVLGPDQEALEAMSKYWQKELIARNYRFQVANKVKLMKAFEFQMSAIHTYYAPGEIEISSTDLIDKYLSDLKEYLILQGYFRDKEAKESDYREMWVQIRSYLFEKKYKQKLLDWMKEKDFEGRWMPEGTNSLYEISVGEYPWSSYLEYYLGDTEEEQDFRDVPPAPCYIDPTANDYNNEKDSEFCPSEIAGKFIFPCKRLFDSLDLKWDGKNGFWSNGKLIIYLSEGKDSAIYINKKRLSEYLEQTEQEIVWTVLGEKQKIVGMGFDNFPGRSEFSYSYYLDNNELKMNHEVFHVLETREFR